MAFERIDQGGGMDAYLLWLIIGIVLIIVEMTTGTFYLLVLGFAALAAAAARRVQAYSRERACQTRLPSS
jgi:membrane-bound ClpP family serine protease